MPETTLKDYAALRESISERYNSLSKRLRDIAKFALDHPTDMALETIAVISERAQVPPSALIRFAQVFNYSGFSEMQRAFQSRVVERSASYKERVRTIMASEKQSDQAQSHSLLTQFCNANILSLEELRDNVKSADLETATDILDAADNIYIMAQRRSFALASYLSYALSHSDCRPWLLDGNGGMLIEQAQTMREKDVLITASFPPYAADTTKVATIASEKGIPIIAITDNALSPVSKMANVCFKVHDAEVLSFRSLSGSMCIAQTLATALAFRLKDNDLSATLPTNKKKG